MAFNWEELIVSAVVGPVTVVGREKLGELLNKLKEKNEKTYKSAIVGLYQIIDLQLEDLTSTTKTKIDDALIIALKGAIEDSALANGIVLQNLDQD